MPITETDVQYEFPRTDHERAFFIDFHSSHDRMWVSTSLKEGRMRMKFAQLEWRPVKSEMEIDWNAN